jgi:membrane carboxypeptidase/penicillin-binding protein PbpC
VHWLLNGRLVGQTTPDAPTLRLVVPGPGSHALTALDAAGLYQQVVFSVR